eukprot:366073-Chlamydomonas_euryale.AAC.11
MAAYPGGSPLAVLAAGLPRDSTGGTSSSSPDSVFLAWLDTAAMELRPPPTTGDGEYPVDVDAAAAVPPPPPLLPDGFFPPGGARPASRSSSSLSKRPPPPPFFAAGTGEARRPGDAASKSSSEL